MPPLLCQITHLIRTVLFTALVLAALPASAGDNQRLSAEEMKTFLQQHANELKVERVIPAPLANMYRVEYSDGSMTFITDDARFFFRGDIVEVSPDRTQMLDLTAQFRGAFRRSIVAAIDPADMIIFPAQPESAYMTILTDTCRPFCVQQYSLIEEIVSQGITVRVAPWPRVKAGEPGYQEMVNIWCSADRHQALQRAMSGEQIPAQHCDHPIERIRQTLIPLDIRGVPFAVLDNGSRSSGVVEPAAVLKSAGASQVCTAPGVCGNVALGRSH